jgi:hypothetical protein
LFICILPTCRANQTYLDAVESWIALDSSSSLTVKSAFRQAMSPFNEFYGLLPITTPQTRRFWVVARLREANADVE